jgi:hypothetical protein
MKRAPWFLLISLFLFMPGLAIGGLDGNELLQKCEPIEKLYDDPASMDSKEASGVVYCLGYIDSFIETFYFQVQAKILPSVPYCMPEEQLPKKEIAKVIIDYLKNHPEELGKPAGYFIFLALREAFPCREETNKAEEEKEE